VRTLSTLFSRPRSSASALCALLALLWTAAILTISSAPPSRLYFTRHFYSFPRHVAQWASGSERPEGVWRHVAQQDYTRIFDKPFHAAEFAVLVMLWWGACATSSRHVVRARALVLACGMAFCTALADETRQAGVPGREMRASDLAADWVGIAAGAGLAVSVRRRPEAQDL
jgi:VanZ family protein